MCIAYLVAYCLTYFSEYRTYIMKNTCKGFWKLALYKIWPVYLNDIGLSFKCLLLWLNAQESDGCIDSLVLLKFAFT
jgi:hypothetical protein